MLFLWSALISVFFIIQSSSCISWKNICKWSSLAPWYTYFKETCQLKLIFKLVGNFFFFFLSLWKENFTMLYLLLCCEWGSCHSWQGIHSPYVVYIVLSRFSGNVSISCFTGLCLARTSFLCPCLASHFLYLAFGIPNRHSWTFPRRLFITKS